MIYESEKKKILIEYLKAYVGKKIPTAVGISNGLEQKEGVKITRQTVAKYLKELKNKGFMEINSHSKKLIFISDEPLLKKPGSSRSLKHCSDEALLDCGDAVDLKEAMLKLVSWAGIGLTVPQNIENLIYDLTHNLGYDDHTLEYGYELMLRNNIDSYNYNTHLSNYIITHTGKEDSMFYFPEGSAVLGKLSPSANERYKLIDTLLMICSQRSIERLYITFITSNYKDPIKMFSYRVPR